MAELAKNNEFRKVSGEVPRADQLARRSPTEAAFIQWSYSGTSDLDHDMKPEATMSQMRHTTPPFAKHKSLSWEQFLIQP